MSSLPWRPNRSSLHRGALPGGGPGRARTPSTAEAELHRSRATRAADGTCRGKRPSSCLLALTRMVELVRRIPLATLSAETADKFLADEWLIGNGLGGYASGTIVGVTTRRYHGLLV